MSAAGEAIKVGELGIPITTRTTIVHPHSSAINQQALIYQYLNSDEGKKVLERIDAMPEVEPLRNRGMTNSLGGWSIFHSHHLASWWVWRANACGRHQADEDLREFFANDQIDVDMVYWLGNLEVAEALQLGSQFELLPANDFYEVEDKEDLLKIDLSQRGDWSPKATSVLRRRVKAPRDIDRDEDRGFSNEDRQLNLEFELASLAINCFNGVGVKLIHSSSYLPPHVPHFGTVLCGGKAELQGLGSLSDTVEIDPAEFELLLTALVKMQPKYRDRICTALRRLNSAKLSKSPHDFALDLGIALEILLFLGDGTKSEIRHKFSTRGAWLIGENSADRMAKAKQLAQIYDQRSDVAHGGLVKFKSKAAGSFQATKLEQLEIAECAFQRVIIEGVPDWSSLTLGGEGWL